ncbi:hypothetical protein B6U83_03600 [Thermoplasmatales archaeon ex4484_36]|nr:MAG: hypothetical protein B6U83_03600 [Thermoplasmatales archaeon ex4484_36]
MVMELEEILGRVRRYSRFSGRPIKEESLRRIFKMARRAPAPGGSLPLRFIVVRDEVLKKKLAEACGKRMFFAEAPIIVVAAALPDEAEPFMGGYTNSFLLDSSSALTLLTLAAQEEGLGTHWTLHFKDEKMGIRRTRGRGTPQAPRTWCSTVSGRASPQGAFSPQYRRIRHSSHRCRRRRGRGPVPRRKRTCGSPCT